MHINQHRKAVCESLSERKLKLLKQKKHVFLTLYK